MTKSLLIYVWLLRGCVDMKVIINDPKHIWSKAPNINKKSNSITELKFVVRLISDFKWSIPNFLTLLDTIWSIKKVGEQKKIKGSH